MPPRLEIDATASCWSHFCFNYGQQNFAVQPARNCPPSPRSALNLLLMCDAIFTADCFPLFVKVKKYIPIASLTTYYVSCV